MNVCMYICTAVYLELVSIFKPSFSGIRSALSRTGVIYSSLFSSLLLFRFLLPPWLTRFPKYPMPLSLTFNPFHPPSPTPPPCTTVLFSSQCVKKSSNIVKSVYGESSVEFGYELRKLGEVALRLDDVRGALDATRQSKAILERCYSSRHRDVAELAETEKQLERILE